MIWIANFVQRCSTSQVANGKVYLLGIRKGDEIVGGGLRLELSFFLRKYLCTTSHVGSNLSPLPTISLYSNLKVW
jgi:hypothetical protein